MMTTILHRVFAAVRFVQLEWAAWCDREERSTEKLIEVEQPTIALSDEQLRRLGIEQTIRAIVAEKLPSVGCPEWTEERIQSAIEGFIQAQDKIRAEREKYVSNGRR